MGADVIILDDPLNPKMAQSDTERGNVNTAYKETFYSRTKDPATAVRIIVMQRLHEEDLSGMLIEDKRTRHICIPAEETENIKPESLKKKYEDGLFWKQRFTRDILDEYKESLGGLQYAGQMLQEPAPLEGNLFKKEWFNIVDKAPEECVWDFKIDPAYTSKTQNDPSAILAYSYHNEQFYFRKVEQKWLEFPQLCEYIKKFTQENGYTRQSRIYVEPKASGKSIVQQMRATTGLNILEDRAPDTDKVTRANAVSSIVEAGRVNLVKGGWNETFISEVLRFPNAKHDDQVDVMVMALQGRKIKKGFVVI